MVGRFAKSRLIPLVNDHRARSSAPLARVFSVHVDESTHDRTRNTHFASPVARWTGSGPRYTVSFQRTSRMQDTDCNKLPCVRFACRDSLRGWRPSLLPRAPSVDTAFSAGFNLPKLSFSCSESNFIERRIDNCRGFAAVRQVLGKCNADCGKFINPSPGVCIKLLLLLTTLCACRKG